MIDIHVHLHPPRLSAAIRKWFKEKSDWELYHPTDPQDVCQALREQGVERFVFCSYAHKSSMARELNEWLVQTSKDIQGYGLPLCTVHPDDPDAVSYIQAAFEGGCIGLKIHEDVQRFNVDDPRLSSIYRVIAKHRGFVLAHVGPIPWDNNHYKAPDRVAQVLRANPAVNFVIAHMGAPDTNDYLKLLDELPNLYLDTTMALALQFKAHTKVDADIFKKHPQRIVFGTDYPNIPYPYEYEVKLLDELDLTELARKHLFHDNAAHLMRLASD
jgi:uncharacterized protein